MEQMIRSGFCSSTCMNILPPGVTPVIANSVGNYLVIFYINVANDVTLKKLLDGASDD
uniref:Uncharacterized protein n=1 Tax=Arundo donax TaxID=35708 RepID=A0A0A8YIJ8_ARUDO